MAMSSKTSPLPTSTQTTFPSCWATALARSEEHTSELHSQSNLVCRLLLAKKNGLRVLSRLTIAQRTFVRRLVAAIALPTHDAMATPLARRPKGPICIQCDAHATLVLNVHS